MKRILTSFWMVATLSLVSLGAAGFGPAAMAAAGDSADVRTVTFVVDKMTCAMCPITVRKAMQALDGVTAVDVSFEDKTARVTYDANRVSVEDIARASAAAGYPARPAS